MALSVAVAGLLAFLLLLLVFKLLRTLFKAALLVVALAFGAWLARGEGDALQQRLHAIAPFLVDAPPTLTTPSAAE